MSEWRDEINRKALARLNGALPAVFPRPALIHALGRRFTPPMPRLAVDSYWRAPPGWADRPPPAPGGERGGPPRGGWRAAGEKGGRGRRGGRQAGGARRPPPPPPPRGGR